MTARLYLENGKLYKNTEGTPIPFHYKTQCWDLL